MAKFGIKGARGFSMIELSMVLGLIAVTTAFSVPMLTNSMRSMQLISDARSIATTMTYARMSATSQMTRYQLNFDLGNNTWNLQKRNRNTGNYEIQQAVNGLSNGIAHSGIAFRTTSSTAPTGFPTTSSTSITFNSRGIPNGIAIVYLSNNEMNYAVSVSLAGKVQVWRFQNEQWAPV
jgi:prepilin-type N-terminal cleavage/methylation domain-containing protein